MWQFDSHGKIQFSGFRKQKYVDKRSAYYEAEDKY